tara:strand:+ start:3360 stop:4580 length:1221 start_codon:yes stop_codon:yes gene_type:complete
MAYKFQIGPAILSGNMTRDAGDLTIRNHANVRKFLVDSVTGDVSGSGVSALGTVNSNANIAASGSITAGTSFIIGDADMSETDLEKLDGITNGTAVANKALVLDGNKDIGTIRNLTIDGVFTDGNYTFDTDGNVSGLGTIGGGAVTSTGASSFGSLSTTTTIAAGSSVSGATSIAGQTVSADGAGTFGSLVSSTTVSGALGGAFGTLTADGGLSMQGSTIISATRALGNVTTFSGSGQADVLSLRIDSVAVTAGAADLNALASFGTATYAPAADSFVFFDADSSTLKRQTNDAFLETIKGEGLAIVGNKLTVEGLGGATALSPGTNMVLGVNYAAADISAATSVGLPATANAGEKVTVKCKGMTSTLTVSGSTGSHKIDGQDAIVLESPYAAVTMVYVANNDWRII